MILRALAEYYARVADEPGTPAFGFSQERVSFCLVLEPDGRLHQVEDMRREEQGRLHRRPMIVPDRGGRSGSGVQPNFLWDNTGYVLGRDRKGKPKRSAQTFAAFGDLHRQFAGALESESDSGFQAVLAFLGAWNPSEVESRISNWDEVCDTNLVFRLRGRQQFVHESESVREAWVNFRATHTDSSPGICLATGAAADIARLHPLIRGVRGAQSTGASIVSFNLDAFESYGKSQSYNAPVSVDAAFRYTTALNLLLADRAHRIVLGDITVVFWTEQPTVAEVFFGPILDEDAIEDDEVRDRVRAFLGRLRKGSQAIDDLANVETRFFVLGLSPNASRLSIRFWLQTSVAELFERLCRHVEDVEMTGLPMDEPPPSLRQLLRETSREAKDIHPLLAGSVMRSILTESPYPEALGLAVIRRIRAEAAVNHRRAAILKAWLIRRFRSRLERREVPVTLNHDHPDPAYHLGRYFAVLERIQRDALGEKLSRTIRDSFFSAASATPSSVFPRLIRLSQHHLANIENPGLRVVREKLIQEIVSCIGSFPAHLSLEEQGLFFIAYYHQTRDFYTSKSDAKETATNA